MEGCMSGFLKYFVRGSLFLVPLAATLWVVLKVLGAVDSIARLPEAWLGVRLPGLGIVLVVVGTTLAGYLVTHFFTRRWAAAIDAAMQRLPLVKLIHGSIKDLIGAFVGDKASFDSPVLLQLGAGGDVTVLGFVTRSDLGRLDLPGWVAVYVPQSYNFAANLVLVPRERVRQVDLPASEVMTFIVSGGLSGLVSAPTAKP
jgi:uncharacterized membrane protein